MTGRPTRRDVLTAGGVALLASRAATAPVAPVAVTTAGKVRGAASGKSIAFKGIRYGQDTAPSRFQPPLPQPWPGIRDALVLGPASPQPKPPNPASEDCLFLNVWTPALTGKRPVMVYIHGGAYSSGSASTPLTDGAWLAAHGDVVVVTLNHRLGPFGYAYIPGPDLADSGNAGMLDLVLALQWVRDNAAAFGGDPACVTLFGQSGGGAKIATLMAMPAAHGLFHRAITMSGQQVTASGPLHAAQRTQALLGALGVTAAQLRTLPAARIVAALATIDPVIGQGSLYFGPVVDQRSLTRHPFFPDAPPQSAAVPMMIGNSHDETRSLIGPAEPHAFDLNWGELPGWLARHMRADIDPATVIAAYRRLYPAYTASEVFFAATTAARSWRGAVEELQVRAAQGASTWAYQLDWRTGVEGDKWRAPHTLDIALAFGTLAAPGSLTGVDARAQAMSGRIADVFVAFARTGVAGWPCYTLPDRATMVFDEVSRAEDDPRRDERRLFAAVPFVQSGT